MREAVGRMREELETQRGGLMEARHGLNTYPALGPWVVRRRGGGGLMSKVSMTASGTAHDR